MAAEAGADTGGGGGGSNTAEVGPAAAEAAAQVVVDNVSIAVLEIGRTAEPRHVRQG